MTLTPNPSPASRARGTPLPRPHPAVLQQARDNRKAPTKSEGAIWRALRNRRFFDHKFRRQQPVGPFILDFYCREAQLAIEIDGGVHRTQRASDRARQQALESLGIRFLRIPAGLVECDLNAALNHIDTALRNLPSPAATGEGQGVRA